MPPFGIANFLNLTRNTGGTRVYILANRQILTTVMSPSVESAQSQWLAQLAAMREAIAELKLPADCYQSPSYGQDIILDNDDLSGTASGEDIWDVISDEYEEEYSSDQLDEVDGGHIATGGFDQLWLASKCESIARGTSGLNAKALQEQLMAILASDSTGRFSRSLRNIVKANDINR